MTSCTFKRMLSLFMLLCLTLCFTTASAAPLKGGTTSGVATVIEPSMYAKPYTISLPWSTTPVYHWYAMTASAPGTYYVSTQVTSGYSFVNIQCFKGAEAVDEIQEVSYNQQVFPLEVTTGETVYFCIFCYFPTGSGISFSVCFDGCHAFGEVGAMIKPATCQETGLRSSACSLCGHLGEAEETPVTDHVAGEWVVYTPASCDHDGVKAQLCSMCGEVMTTQTIPAGHHFGKWMIEQMPVAGKDGIQIRTCTECGSIESKSISSGQ